MEIDRMWILGWKMFVRDGDIYVGITSKPNTIAAMVEFDEERYGRLSWANPRRRMCRSRSDCRSQAADSAI